MLQTYKQGNWFVIVVPDKWGDVTIDVLFRQIWGCPKKLTHHFRMEHKVQVNGQRASWTVPLKAGSKLALELFSEEQNAVPPAYLDVPVLFEDDHLIVFNKQAGMLTHPNDPSVEKNTLLNAAVFYNQANGAAGEVRHIHRLDQDTTGAILFAKHSFAGSLLDRMLETRKIKRTYLAIVHGFLPSKKGAITEPIGRDRHHATRRRVSPSGQAATTHYEVIKVDIKKKLSYVKCTLDTGRTHQIRVHLSHIGHPLAGDTLYGGEPIFGRQALHAGKLEFIHPLTEEKIICHAPFIDQQPIFKDIDVDVL